MNPPKIDNAPGLKWRPINAGFQARWRARTDLIHRGWPIKSLTLWQSTREQPEPSDIDKAYISDKCNSLQADMLNWGHTNGVRFVGTFTGTLMSLVDCYRSDPDSPYHDKRYNTRGHYDTLCRRIEFDSWLDADKQERRIADTLIEEIDARMLKRWHEVWGADGKIAMGHSMIGMLRSLMTFGATILKSKECREVKTVLHDMRFKMPRRRSVYVTAEQATAIRMEARAKGKDSMALAQALQFELMLRQKDVIGEWVPISEPGVSDVMDGNDKWLRGIRAEEIDENLILRHTTSKRDKPIEVDLRLAPMVVEEFRYLAGLSPDQPLERGHLPASGPLIMNEGTSQPYTAELYRRTWRELARATGIPDGVKNMDSRAGAITEASDGGADLEKIRHAATHSNIATTQGYSRGATEKTAEVMRIRVAHRNKSGTP